MSGAQLPTSPGHVEVALVMDVDGVVSAVHPVRGAWGDEVDAGDLSGPVRVSPTLCRRLDAIAALPHVVPLWLTSWLPESRQKMAPFPGRTWETLKVPAGSAGTAAPAPDPDRLDWWKWDALRTWLRTRPDIRTLVWCDDQLAQLRWADEGAQDSDGRPPGGRVKPSPSEFALKADDASNPTAPAALIVERLAQAGIAATLVVPETSVGLTPEDLDRVETAVGQAPRF